MKTDAMPEDHNQAINRFEEWWRREGELMAKAMPASKHDEIKVMCMIAWSNGVYCATHKAKKCEPRIKQIPTEIMMSMPPSWRKRWCNSQACACIGCANVAGGLSRAGFTEKDHSHWLSYQND